MNYDPGPIPAFLDRKPVIGNYTALRNYQNCPHAMYHRNIAYTYPFVSTPAIEEGNAIHAAMEMRLRAKQSLPPKYAQWEPFAQPFDNFHDTGDKAIAVELKLGITRDGKSRDYSAKDVWFRGRIDVAVVDGAKAYILDWKSGGSKYEDPFELEIGAVLLQARNNARSIKGQFAWLAENRLGTLYDLSDTNATFAKMKHLMDEIEGDKKRNWFEKRKSGLCGYCPVADCEHHFVARPK